MQKKTMQDGPGVKGAHFEKVCYEGEDDAAEAATYNAYPTMWAINILLISDEEP